MNRFLFSMVETMDSLLMCFDMRPVELAFGRHCLSVIVLKVLKLSVYITLQLLYKIVNSKLRSLAYQMGVRGKV